MTRLTSEWITDMEEKAAGWNDELRLRIGLDYIDLAAKFSGRSRKEILKASEVYKVAVIPVTSGLGTISSFSESVAAIVRAMGFDVIVTENTDVNGIYEAYVKGAEILFIADDDRYIAMNRKSGAVGDNNIATASGYAEILLSMAGLSEGAKGAKVAVLGYGIIGQLIASYLTGKGAVVSIYEKDESRKKAVKAAGYGWMEDKSKLKEFKYIADATSEGGWLEAEYLHDEAVIAAPGIPFSLTEEAKTKYAGRYIHDLLEIGTACMIGGAV